MIPRIRTSLHHRIGHRGAFLLFLAFLDFLYGIALRAGMMVPLFPVFLPWNSWAVVWFGVGLVALVGAFVKRDRLAYGLASTLKALWTVVWITIWIRQPFPLEWLNVALWASFAGIVLVISSWPEVMLPKPRKE